MIYKVWADNETEDDAVEFNTPCESTAAEEWAELMDEASGVFEIARGCPDTVWVENVASGARIKLDVFGEFTPTYTAYLPDET
jgi:hypothetical protein